MNNNFVLIGVNRLKELMDMFKCETKMDLEKCLDVHIVINFENE